MILGLAFLGVNVASACGYGGWFGSFVNADPEKIASIQQTMFEKQAQMLGISVDEVKNAWAEGKTISQLAKEKGITAEQLQEKMQNARKEQMKSYLQTLVDKGIITQVQADKRLQFTNTQIKGNKFMKGIGFHSIK